ncbi:MAG TPA: phytoene desaturase family protein [Planosporangium sp.]|nr:phytoene desaturase family protein [Planosporangium sp.]
MSEVVVIGAGVGGLSTALRLAAAGHRVSVYERSGVVGGKLGRHVHQTRAGTFRFDTGPSLLTLPHVVSDLLGDALAEHLVELDPIARHRFADGTVLDSCADQAEFTRRIAAAMGERSADEWRRLWRRAGRVWETSWRHVLTAPARSTLALSRLAWRLGDLNAVAPGQTIRGVGRRYLSDPRMRILLERYATYTGADPRRAPAALLAIPYAEMRYGGWYLRGGLATLADALLARCDELGVRVHTGTRVVEIEAGGGRVHGVRLAGGALVRADIVVANTDALEVYRDLLPDRRRAARLRERGLAGFVMLLGVHGRTPDLAHHTVLFPADYDAEFDDVFGQPRRGVLARPARDPAVFITVADDPLVRPDGHEAWFVLVNAPPHGDNAASVDWTVRETAHGYANRILDLLAARGVEVRDRVLFRELFTPADLQLATASPGGAIYGTPGHGLSGLRRPGNRGPVRGLFLVGGSVHPGGGLPMVMLSAKIVAGQIGSA